jgi:hypothetical protein
MSDGRFMPIAFLHPARAIEAEPRPPHCWIAVIAGLLVTLAYLSFIVSTDNTNLGTTNGLWKTPQVSAWEHGTGAPVDNGGFLYFPTYGTLARWIPDSWVEYGTPSRVVTFRKMAILNGIFGGVASALVFGLSFRFTRSNAAAVVVTLAHAGSAFVLLNSVNSEDIIPAYTFFIGASVCFFEYLESARLWQMVLASVLMALATLFHWTVMAPALAAFGCVLLIVMTRQKSYLWLSVLWLFLFACAVQLLLLMVFPRLHIPVWAALLPTKGTNAGGWVGLSSEKIKYLIIGVGNYFSGGYNEANYVSGLQGGHLRYVVISWLFLALTGSACTIAILGKTTARGPKLLAIFALALWFAGEAGAIYSQPQDPQMQIEPMFCGLVGLILIGRWTVARGRLVHCIGLGLIATVALANTLMNGHLLRLYRGGDSQLLTEMFTFEAQFPYKETAVVCQGFEGYNTWRDVILWQGDAATYFSRTFEIAGPFTRTRGITGAAAASQLGEEIDRALANGLRVIAGALWTQTSDDFAASMTTITSEGEARAFDSTMRSRYDVGNTWQTSLGTFVELVPRRH